MADGIYVVDPATQEPLKAEPVSFYNAGITERNDLQRWVAKDPGLLGEPLLAITSEFNRFDKSNRRLDVLALDTNGTLVVIELKLDASRSLADQQAIRYAAFCSTMTMDDVVEALARFQGSTKEEAAQKVRDFLCVDGLPEVGNRPRIILAGGSIEDWELTTCVLWLRGFGVDISCVELTPYRVPDSTQVILAPRTVIPIREAGDYLIGIEQSRIPEAQQTKNMLARARFWRFVADEFNRLGTHLRATGRASGLHMCLRCGCPSVHYEWIVRRRDARLDVAVHFEFDERHESMQWLEILKPHVPAITDGMNLELELVPWGRRWAEARFRLPFTGSFPSEGLAPDGARVMKVLVERTWPFIRSHVEAELSVSGRGLSKASMALLATANRLESLNAGQRTDQTP